MRNTPLRIGLLIDTSDISAWQYDIVDRLLGDSGIEVALLILVKPSTSNPKPSVKKSSALHKLFLQQDGPLSRGIKDACITKSTEALLATVERIQIAELTGNDVENVDFSNSVRSLDIKLDFILAIAETVNLRRFVGACTYGILRFRHGALGFSDNGYLAGFWEVLHRQPYVRTSLMLLQSGTADEVCVYRTYSTTFYVSHARTRNEHLWKCADIPSRALGAMRVDAKSRSVEINLAMHGSLGEDTFEFPATFSNQTLALPLLRFLLWRLGRKLVKRLWSERWILMYGNKRLPAEVSEFKKIEPPPGRFWADPCILRNGDTDFVFYEDASIETGRGHIAVLAIDGNAVTRDSRAVLQKPYHLSYPFLLEWQNRLFMIPESAENLTIDAYECVSFPYEWKHYKTLMHGRAAYDATLFEYAGRWWMFANIQSRPETSSWDELHLFYADSPLDSSWQSHPMNPVVSDVRYARPAGNLYVADDKIYRPSQDSSHRYGHRLNAMEIVKLSETDYQERLAWSVGPTNRSSIRAVHTYAARDDLTLIDAIYRQRRRLFEKRELN